VLYELRSYEAMPGLMPQLDEHLDLACRLFPNHGLGVLGAWTDEVGTGGRVTYMWSAKDEASRHASLASFAGSAEWKSFAAEEMRKHGTVVAHVENLLLRPTTWWPEAKMSKAVQELRIYEAMPGRMPALQKRFSDHTVGLFKRMGIGIVGFWTEVYGSNSRLVYMLEYDGLGAREAAWQTFAANADWQKVKAESEKDGPLVRRTHNRILRPTRYSPR
jgi:hypothetical protein